MQLFDHLPAAAVQMKPDTTIVRVNEQAQNQFQLGSLLQNQREILFCDLIDDNDKPGFFQFLLASKDGSGKLTPYSTTLVAEEKRIHITTSISTLEDGSHLLLLNKNIPTACGCQNSCLQNKILQAQYQYNPGGILIVNSHMEILTHNQGFIHMWEVPEHIRQTGLDSQNQQHMISLVENPDHFQEKLADLQENPYKSSTDEIKLTNGKTFYRHTYPIFTDTEYLGRVWYFLDISALQRAKEKLQFMAHHDVLTGLPNRRLFHDILRQCLANANRHQTKVGVLFLDLDNFKSINDSHGHELGDELLKDVAQTLKNCLRESDIICRWGGDEFVIALPDIEATEDAHHVAEKLIQSIAAKYTVSPYMIHKIGSSIGIAMYPEHSERPDRLIRNADHAMYLAKRNGKNRFVNFSPDHYHRPAGIDF